MGEVATTRIPAERLGDFCRRVLGAVGVPDDDAACAADVLLAADLRGVDSHGVARLGAYVGGLAAGSINPRPVVRVVTETASTATVDGDNGLGLVVGPKANELALGKAAEAGTGWVSVRNSNHYGIAGWYALRAVERDMVGWSMTNATAIVAPLWGAEKRLGTNPVAIAFPAGEEPPFVLDMATSAVAHGKLEIAMRASEPIPHGWAIDREGEPTTDPAAVLKGGALLPLGGDRDHGGHKGYGLAGVVDLLVAGLSGAAWGPFAPSFTPGRSEPERHVGEGLGHFFGAMRVDAFRDPAEFKASVDDWIRTMRATSAQPGTPGVLVPGDPEREAEADRGTNGVPLVNQVVDQLRQIGERTGVAFEV